MCADRLPRSPRALSGRHRTHPPHHLLLCVTDSNHSFLHQVGALSKATSLDETLVTEVACGPVIKRVDSSLALRIQSMQALTALVWATPVPPAGLRKALTSARESMALPATSPGRHELVLLGHALVGELLRTEGLTVKDFIPVLELLVTHARATPEEGAGRVDVEQMQEAAASADRVLKQATVVHGADSLQQLIKITALTKARTASASVAGSSPSAKRHRGNR